MTKYVLNEHMKGMGRLSPYKVVEAQSYKEEGSRTVFYSEPDGKGDEVFAMKTELLQMITTES